MIAGRASDSISSSTSSGFLGTCAARVKLGSALMHPTLMLEPTGRIGCGAMTLVGVGGGAGEFPCSCLSRSFSSGISAATVFKSISSSSPPRQGLINSNSGGTTAGFVTMGADAGGIYGRRGRVIKPVELLAASRLAGMGSFGSTRAKPSNLGFFTGDCT
ncbi:hypothetical protein ACFX2A_044139 [Malus domestica]